MRAVLNWKLGDHLPKGDQLETQAIDLAWIGEPSKSQSFAHRDHASKIEIYGDDCVSIAERIIRALNAEDAAARQPDRSEQAEADRAAILAAKAAMGSMAQASAYGIVGLDYGRGDFEAALRDASRSQLDRLLIIARPYLGIKG
jgi:hypothetical protein